MPSTFCANRYFSVFCEAGRASSRRPLERLFVERLFVERLFVERLFVERLFGERPLVERRLLLLARLPLLLERLVPRFDFVLWLAISPGLPASTRRRLERGCR
jgi:hypothetical protein